MSDREEDVIQDPEPDLFRIEILSWDWNLALFLSPESMPVEYRFQGGLGYTRGFDLWGRVLTPKSHHGKTTRVWISPFGPDIKFGPDGLEEVGLFYFSSTKKRADLRATLLLPEDAIAPLTAYLGSVSKYVFVRVFDVKSDQGRIESYFFSSTLPESVAERLPTETP